MKENSIKYLWLKNSISQLEYYTSVTTGVNRKYWLDEIKKHKQEMKDMPNDYVDPPFVMPEWGTYGT